MTTPSTLLANATKSFSVSPRGERVVFANLSLSMKPSTCVAVLAPNASGKSTLVHVLLGMEALTRGNVLLRLSDRDLLAAVLQDYRSQLLPWATVRQNLALALGGRRCPQGLTEVQFADAAQDLIGRLGYQISLEARVSTLSGGQQQLLVLVRAALFQPSFWILDEPATALDPRRREGVYGLLDRHYAAGGSALLVTHSIEEALRVADRVLVFDAELGLLADLELERYQSEDRSAFARSPRSSRARGEIAAALGLPAAVST